MLEKRSNIIQMLQFTAGAKARLAADSDSRTKRTHGRCLVWGMSDEYNDTYAKLLKKTHKLKVAVTVAT